MTTDNTRPENRIRCHLLPIPKGFRKLSGGESEGGVLS